MSLKLQHSQGWHDERKHGIGGSEIAAIMGVSPWKTARDVWEEKVGLSSGTETTPIMELGTYLEAFVAERYEQQTGRKVQQRHQQFIHPEHDFLRANIDREILKDPRGVGVLEIKAMGSYPFRQTKLYGLPDYYALQLQHYLMVTGRTWGSFALMNRDNADIIWFDVEPNAEIQKRIIAAAGKFWRHVIDGTPPDEPARETVKLPEMENGEVVFIDNAEWVQAVNDLREAKELADQAKQIEDAAKERVIAIMGNNSVCEGGGARIYYKEQSGRKSFDKKALSKDHPEIDLSNYEKQGDPFRSFKPYFMEVRNGF